MPIPPILDPATFATLASTLGPAGALSQLQAQQLEQQKQLQQATTQMTQESQQAQSQYGQAAASPVPEVAPLDQFLPTLLGGIASVVARDPSFRQHAAEQIGNKRKDLMQARLDNIAALKDIWEKKAVAAQHAGDIAAEQDFRTNLEKTGKLYDQLLENQQHGHGMEKQKLVGQQQLDLERLRQQGDIATAKAKPPAHVPLEDQPVDFNKFVRTSYGGRKFVDMGDMTGNVANVIRIKAAEAGLPIPDKAATSGVLDVARAQKDLDKLEKYVTDLAPKDPQGRITGALNRKIREFTQTEAGRAAFRVWADAAIPVLRATAGSKNLRIAQEQIKIAIKNLPTQHDTIATVKKKLGILRSLLANSEESLLDTNLSPTNAKDPLNLFGAP